MQHTESNLQIACVNWFRLQYKEYSKLLIAIPNHAVLSGNAIQRARQWKRLEAEGAVTGAADLLLFKPLTKLLPATAAHSILVNTTIYHGCFFELKSATGKQSKEQKEFQKQVEAQYYEYVIIRDIESFIKKVKEYFN